MESATSIVARAYADNQAATAPDPARSASQTLGQAANDFAATMRASEDIGMQAMTSGADPHAMVQALAQTELAIETAVTIRNRVVEAYQEILRMPV